jgi:hypothetical protein
MAALTPSEIQYYVGQGTVWAAPRQSNGPIIGPWRNIGDTAELALDFSKQKIVEIEENLTGFGGLSGYASVAIPTMFNMEMVSINQNNLALAMYGAFAGANPGGTVTSESVVGWNSGQFYLQNIGTSNLVLTPTAGQVGSIAVTQGAGYTTAPAVSIAAPPAGGTQATAVATLVSATDITIQITNPGSGYTTAPAVTLTGGGFTTAATATAALIQTTALVSGTDYTPNGAHGGIYPLASAFWAQFSSTAPVAFTASYAYAANQGIVKGLQSAQPEISLRFDGLNVMNPQASGAFGAVVVQLNRCRLDLPKNFAFIGKKEAPLPLSGAIMLDTLATNGSPYFSITQA